MDEQVERLSQKAWSKHKSLPKSARYLIAISGIPGSGKTTLAAQVTKRLNEQHAAQSPGLASSGQLIAAFVPMDGYHLTRAQLDSMPDPATARERRGAEFTFDGEGYLALVKKLREPLCPETRSIYAPSFDHEVKDPVENDVAISPSVKVVLFEGNYLSLSKKPWDEAAALMDERWFVEVEFATARRRLVERHVKAGIAQDEDAAGRRADENDLVNGREIVNGRGPVDEVISSKEDEKWKVEQQGPRRIRQAP